MLAAGLLSLLLAAITGGVRHGPVGARSLAALVYLILFGSIAAYSAYIHLTKVWRPAAARARGPRDRPRWAGEGFRGTLVRMKANT
jgi:hypothetical protein